MIDLSPVEFIDAVGMQAIVGSVRLARASGPRLGMQCPSARSAAHGARRRLPPRDSIAARNGPAATPLTRGGIRAGEARAPRVGPEGSPPL